jgi:hypothetical protein
MTRMIMLTNFNIMLSITCKNTLKVSLDIKDK